MLGIALLLTPIINGTLVRAQSGFWDDRFNYYGFRYGIDAAAMKGDTLFVAGGFVTTNGKRSYGLSCRVNGDWRPWPSGLKYYPQVNVMLALGDELYIGGNFELAGDKSVSGIACLNVKSGEWSTMDGGVLDDWRPEVFAVAHKGDYLYVGGRFDSAGGVPAQNLARWHLKEERWERVLDATAPDDAEITALYVDADTLFVGGSFTEIDRAAARSIAAVDLSTFTMWPLHWVEDPDTNQYSEQVFSITKHGGALYAGGSPRGFYEDSTIRTVARREGNRWLTLGRYSNTDARQIFSYRGRLHRVSYSQGFEGRFGRLLEAWKDTAWRRINRVHDAVDFALSHSDTLIALGSFGEGSTYWHTIAELRPHDSAWIYLDDVRSDGPKSSIYDQVSIGSSVFVSGHYVFSGTSEWEWGVRETIEEWTGSEWRTVLEQEGYDHHLLATDGARLFTLGYESTCGDDSNTLCLRAFQTTTRTWEDLGRVQLGALPVAYRGFGPRMLYYYNNSLYLGGAFDTVNGLEAHNVARFDLATRSWTALGPGIPTTERAVVVGLTHHEGAIIAVGSFDSLGLKNVAAFDPVTQTWSSVLPCNDWDGDVTAVETYRGDLILGGTFRNVCGVTVNHLLRWDGERVTPLGPGIDDYWYGVSVEDIHAAGEQLYVGGMFRTIGGDSVSSIGRWDGQQWHALGEGTDDRVMRITSMGNDVYVGGWFSVAGPTASDNFALWHSQLQRVQQEHPSNLPLQVEYLSGRRIAVYPGHSALPWRIRVVSSHGIEILDRQQRAEEQDEITLRFEPWIANGNYLLQLTSGKLTRTTIIVLR